MANFILSELEVKDVKLGAKQVDAIYFREEQVWPTSKEEYLTIIPAANGTLQKSLHSQTFQYSTNKRTWNNASSDTIIPLTSGQPLYLKGELTPDDGRGVGTINVSVDFEVEGTPMSLLYGDNFKGQKSLAGKTSAFMDLFNGSSVTSIENMTLPATTLEQNCYLRMFNKCTLLKNTMKELPAAQAPDYAYMSMFSGCTSLTAISPTLMTALAVIGNSSCLHMFRQCSSLTSVPTDMFSSLNTIGDSGMAYTFAYCDSLKNAPRIPASTIGTAALFNAFNNDFSMTSAPTDMFSNLTETIPLSGLRQTFYYCTKLEKAPKIYAKNISNHGLSYTFYNCSGMTSLPTDMFSNLQSIGSSGMYYTFQYCYRLKSPPKMSVKTIQPGGMIGTFYRCSGMTSAPTDMFSNLQSVSTSGMSNAFYGCSKLQNAPDLPATALGASCYAQMFRNCTLLKESPVLPAKTLNTGSYSNMFNGCTSLSAITCYAEDISATNCLQNWVSGVPTGSGVFVKSPDATWMDAGVNGVPDYWEVPVAWLYLTDGNMKYITVTNEYASIGSETISSAQTSAQTLTDFSVSKVLLTNLCRGIDENAFNPYVGQGTPYYTTTEYDLMHSRLVWTGAGSFCLTKSPKLEFPSTLVSVGAGGLAAPDLRELIFHSPNQPEMSSGWFDPDSVFNLHDGSTYIRSGGVLKYPAGADYSAWDFYAVNDYGWSSQEI